LSRGRGDISNRSTFEISPHPRLDTRAISFPNADALGYVDFAAPRLGPQCRGRLLFLLLLSIPLAAQEIGKSLPAWSRRMLDIHEISTGRGNVVPMFGPYTAK
jgi:hypothetical protein